MLILKTVLMVLFYQTNNRLTYYNFPGRKLHASNYFENEQSKLRKVKHKQLLKISQ